MERESVDGGAKRSTTELAQRLRARAEAVVGCAGVGPSAMRPCTAAAAEQMARGRIEPVVIDGVAIGELARAAQEAQDTGTDCSDEPFDVGVGDVGDGMEVGVRVAE